MANLSVNDIALFQMWFPNDINIHILESFTAHAVFGDLYWQYKCLCLTITVTAPLHFLSSPNYPLNKR